MLETCREFKSYVVKDVCMDMDLSDDTTSHVIKIYEKISKIEWKYWRHFFKEIKKSLLVGIKTCKESHIRFTSINLC